MADHSALDLTPSSDVPPRSPASWGTPDDGAPGERAPGRRGPGRREPGEGPAGGRVADRLRGWWAPTPAELVGLAVLLLGALVASVLWWYPAVTGPGGARATGGPPAAGTGAEVNPDGQAVGRAPGVEADASDRVAGDAGSGTAAAGASPGAAAAAPPGDGAAGSSGSGAAAAPATGTVTVHVTGGVAAAGVVTLPGDARVGDAVAAVGGWTDDADLERINLARVLVDGEHVHVTRIGEEPVIAAPGPATGTGAVGVDGPLDLNRASATELETLPGIGPTRAAAIVEHRERHGPFAVPGDLRAVSGIGEATFQTLAPLVVVR